MIEIIPAIDLIDGRCVRLVQGDYGKSKVYDTDPLDAARRFEDAGIRRLHVVDLDGAKASEPRNLHVLERLSAHTGLSIEYGGGIKSRQSLQNVFAAGAERAIGGSIAIWQPEEFASWIDEFGGGKIVLGTDIRNGVVAVQGWLEDTGTTAEELIRTFVPHGIAHVICTDISRDGMLCGPAEDLYAGLQAKFPAIEITVSGGISSIDDIKQLNNIGLCSVIVGKALYEGRITLKEIELCLQNG